MKRLHALLLALAALLLASCGAASAPAPAPADAPADPASAEAEAPAPRTADTIVRELVLYYASYGSDAARQNETLLAELRALDPDQAARWEKILDLWASLDAGLEIHEGQLPEGLPDTDELCLVVLGFQLAPDGSMREELIERLNVALRCAEQYPQAWICCTGGGTASQNKSATEAGMMAAYLIEQGVAPERILVEDRSQTTAQNAAFSLALLSERCPQVRSIAIVSSDYHIATGALLFSAQAILTAEDPDSPRYAVISNAAWPAPSGSLSTMFQAGALIELSGDIATAYDIYFDTYDIHELPPPEGLEAP